MFDLQQLEQAQAIVAAAMPPTPQYAWPLLVAARSAPSVWVKHENHTPMGAFKLRGGLIYVDRLERERPEVAGIISATRGNHGQSLAYAASRHGVPVMILVPNGNSGREERARCAPSAPTDRARPRLPGGTRTRDALAVERGFEMVPPFHRDLACGVGTYALELFSAVADLDAVYAPSAWARASAAA